MTGNRFAGAAIEQLVLPLIHAQVLRAMKGQCCQCGGVILSRGKFGIRVKIQISELM